MNGCNLQPHHIGNALEKTLRLQIQATIRNQVSTVRCPIYGTAPTHMVAQGQRINHMRFEAHGCGNALGKQVTHLLD